MDHSFYQYVLVEVVFDRRGLPMRALISCFTKEMECCSVLQTKLLHSQRKTIKHSVTSKYCKELKEKSPHNPLVPPCGLSHPCSSSDVCEKYHWMDGTDIRRHVARSRCSCCIYVFLLLILKLSLPWSLMQSLAFTSLSNHLIKGQQSASRPFQSVPPWRLEWFSWRGMLLSCSQFSATCQGSSLSCFAAVCFLGQFGSSHRFLCGLQNNYSSASCYHSWSQCAGEGWGWHFWRPMSSAYE